MAEAAVTILLRSLSELEIYHGDLIHGAERELLQLKNEVALLKAFLQDEADSLEEGRDMKSQIREVVYEVEDTVESYLSQEMTAPRISKKSWTRHFSSKNVTLAHMVQSLRKDKVENLLKRVKDYDSTSKESLATSSTKRRTRLTRDGAMRSNIVVGLEDEENTVVGYLMKEKEDVINLYGMVGLGKTTLARKIYESERITSRFRTRIWVHLSRNFEMKDVFHSILRSFTVHDMSSLSMKDLTNTLRALLKEENFFLVLDNVCSPRVWQAFQPILPSSNGKAKVLITSRENHVANVKPYKMPFLRQYESWELLRLHVFGNLGGCPQELEEIGRCIAAKCLVPLQIVALSGILSDQLKVEEWRKVSENGDLFLNSEVGICNMVELSYGRLPGELRECFLYMGVFPEDHEISVWTLTRLWIAEGFVKPTTGKRMEETAVENLDHLISRNLVIADKVNFNGEAKTCRLHDMVRAFCVTKSIEQNLFQEMKDSEIAVKNNPRRLIFHHDPSTFLSRKLNGVQTRSFLCFSKQPVKFKAEYTLEIQESFPKLRILESNSIKFEKFLAMFSKLIHLRYLTLSVDALKNLPESLSLLWNLQTLVVETTSPTLEMKANIWRMIQLRHLKTDAAILLSSKGEAVSVAGEKLQTLDKLSPESCTESVFKRACNLKKLGVRGNLSTHSQHMFLEKLVSLEKLKLVNESCDKIPSKNMLAGVIKSEFLPPYLNRLTLTNTFLEWKHMSVLATIKSLEILKLKCNAFIGSHWSAANEGFHNLQFLLISDADLVQWEAADNSFPRLKFLVLKDCEKLEQIPMAMEKTLEVLDIDFVSKSAVRCAREIEEVKKKMQGPFKLSIGRGCYC